jgi:hypothetical protein
MEPINYNRDLEQLLAQSAEECESLGILHLASYEKYNLLSNYINIPVIILSSGIGFITGIDLEYEKMNIILGIGSVFVGIIKSVDSYFQLGKRAEAHRLCALQYTQINKKIQIELSLCREQRQTAKDMLSIIKTDIKNLQDISPIIDKEIIAQYNLKYGKYSNVKKPNFVNGLSEVKINMNSLDDEALASLAHSVRGGFNNNNNNNNGNGNGNGSSDYDGTIFNSPPLDFTNNVNINSSSLLPPSAKPTPQPSAKPTPQPSAKPTPQPSAKPTPQPSAKSTPQPSAKPTPQPSAKPTPQPSAKSTPQPSAKSTPPPSAKKQDFIVSAELAFSTPTPTPSLSYDATILNPPELTLDQNQISASDDNDNMNFVIDVPDNLPENNDDDLGAM